MFFSRFKRIFLALIFFFFSTSLSFSLDEPFSYSSNTGTTGLLETPSARTIKEHSYTLGISQVDPYRYYYVVFSPLRNLEITGRITEILNVPASKNDPKWKGYGNYKDKAIDIKYKLIDESKYLPAVALGIMDPHGTRLYSSQYLVISKQIYPFDFTLGFGNGRFGEKQLSPQGEGIKIEMLQNPLNWIKESKFFGGVEFCPNKNFSLILEYSSIEYHKQLRDPAQKKYFTSKVPSQFNFGVRIKPLDWIDITLSYQRGNRLGGNVSFNFDIGKPLIPIRDKEIKIVDNFKTPEERIAKTLNLLGFSDIGVYFNENSLYIEAQNDKYFYTPKAFDVILKVIFELKDMDFEYVSIVLKYNNIPIASLETERNNIIDYLKGELTKGEFYSLSKLKTDIYERKTKEIYYKRFVSYGFKPTFQTFLNDPSGFFKYRFGLIGWSGLNLWDGGTFIIGVEGYPINTVSTVNEPLSIPVRTDLPFFMKEKASLGRLMFDQINKFQNEFYTKFSIGFLEIQYAGLDMEIAKPFLKGRIMLGLSGSIVKKRAIGRPLEFEYEKSKDYYITGFLNARINIPEKEIFIDLKTGRFLAGDFGTRISISKFINGVIISAWYSFTDTSVFKDILNKGYHDKGLAVSIPIRLFEGSDSKTSYSYSLSPWTRDVAQDINHYNNLFDFIGRNQKIYLDKDRYQR